MPQVFERKLSDDVTVTADVGYGASVSFELSVHQATFTCQFETEHARELAQALLDAANEADRLFIK